MLLAFSVNSSLWVFSVTSGLGHFRVYKLRHDHERVYKEISIAPELTHITPELALVSVHSLCHKKK